MNLQDVRIEIESRGMEVLATKPTDTSYLKVVLVHNVNDTETPYVTWNVNVSRGSADTESGHYFKNLKDAMADFNERG